MVCILEEPCPSIVTSVFLSFLCSGRPLSTVGCNVGIIGALHVQEYIPTYPCYEMGLLDSRAVWVFILCVRHSANLQIVELTETIQAGKANL